MKRSAPLRRRSYLKRFGKESAKWKEYRAKVAASYRAKGFEPRCVEPNCGIESESLDLHHLIGRNVRPDLKYEITNLIFVCRTHHRKLHETICEKGE